MRYRPFGDEKREVAVVGQGTWTLDTDPDGDNAAAAGLELTDGEAFEIQTTFPRGPRRFGVPTL